MDLSFEVQRAASYASASQKIRVLSERWVGDHVYCPNCGHCRINRYAHNRPVADFVCPICREDYELKSHRKPTAKLVDGAYRTMVERLKTNRNPNLFLLNYDWVALSVLSLIIIPKHFFTTSIIERRRPLAETARRAGWVGCNILLQDIPDAGRIFIIRNRHVESKTAVLAKWKRTIFLREERDSAKGWLLNVIRCIEKLKQRTFSLDQVYSFEGELRETYPKNRHIKAKIRQQLQVLRDKGYIEFIGGGTYRLAEQIE